MTITLGAILLAAAVVLFIVQPMIAGLFAPMEKTDDEATDAEALRRVKLLALRDVEYDYQMGKLDQADYASLKKELSKEALEALAATQREAEGVGDSDLESEIARVKAGLASGDGCPSCGFRNPSGSRFCSACGGPLETKDGAEVAGGSGSA